MRKMLQKLRVKIGAWKKQIMLGLLMGGVALRRLAWGGTAAPAATRPVRTDRRT